MNKPVPFFLKPVGKDYLWGGNRLKDDFGKSINMKPLAESWECSTHPDGISVVGSGIYKGRPLDEVLKYHPEYIGSHPKSHKNLPQGQLPILIKLIDAKKDLSIQVHPDDEYAQKYEHGQLGKTEMWYVLDADRNTKLIYGLKKEVSRERLQNSIISGTFDKFLRYVPVQKNDVFCVESGTIHAIGAGALIAEIQENSNLTYRLYDYNRTDESGNQRELHIEKGLDVANLKLNEEPKQPIRTLKYQPGYASELLCRCRYFQVERILLNTERNRDMILFSATETSFLVLLCIEGCGVMFFEEDHIEKAFPIFKGDCIFVPSGSIEFKIHEKLQILKTCC